MSKAKFQANANAQPAPCSSSSSGGSFASGFICGQLLLGLILLCFIKFFIFGEAPSADDRAASRASSRRQRTLSHHNAASGRQRTLSSALRPRPSSAMLKPKTDGALTVQKILEKTYYNVHGHQPESLDWFNVLIAQTIAQLRTDAQEDAAVLSSLTAVLNGPTKPAFLDDIRVTEISLGDEFPIFSNCRVIPVDEHGTPIKELKGNRGEMLQARMDVDLSDVLTLGVETKLVLNYPKPSVAVLPVALAVSVVRFSGTLSVSFSPSSQPNPYPNPDPTNTNPPPPTPHPAKNEGHPLNPTGSSPTTLTFTFLDDYRLDLSVHSLIGSRSRLQDVPKIAQLVEDRLHRWFDDRCVEPRFQQIVLPSFWPRKRNTRGGGEQGDSDDESGEEEEDDGRGGGGSGGQKNSSTAPSKDAKRARARSRTWEDAVLDGPAPDPGAAPRSRKEGARRDPSAPAPAPSPSPAAGGKTPQPPKADITAEQRTRDWAKTHGKGSGREMSELERAGREMREADERERRRGVGGGVEGEGVRLRGGKGGGLRD